MPLSSVLVFAVVYAVAVASPGPGVFALVARVLARGTRGIPAFIAGFLVGDLLWFSIAAAGFALLAQSFATLFVGIRYLGAAYLAYLAWRAWTAPVEPLAGEPVRGESGPRLFLGGLALTLGNPKVVLFFLALLPTVIDLEHLTPLGMIEIAATIVVVLGTTLAAYALAAARVRRIFVSVRARRAVNRGAGTVMAGAAIAVATR
ncbi:LysE family translocator [Methylobacterium gregans]|uniref:Leucine efflux protein n=1 Tax=Methylobacterium gregans TaxID=374424 RepID=A0AA37HPI0_9HYPH|nr:LysE family translocator [Methylobacterium gregans]MDQ0519417.1 threonine/homoserine/homoserine lactone efflux protein [Methylobacterium gregans]GJD79403.1 Leucine efflux protein [Methylobacterium gregans]GLS52941.1 lysine transporter LysE [Methylobacterium gregans]